MKDIITNFVDELRNYESIAIIGLGKNAGKTTTLNSVLELLDYQDVMLTSIGFDGEETDLVFGNKKPTIFVKKDTVIATAKKCLLTSGIQFEILETTGFKTPLGEIIIARSLEDGLVELAGPSYNKQLKEVIRLLKSFKDGLVLVDGALNRKSFSDPSVCDKTILCSGMILSDNIEEVAKQTIFTVNILSLPVVIEDKELINKTMQRPISIIDNEKKIYTMSNKSTISHELEIVKLLDKNSRYLVLNGPLTDKLAMQLIKYRDKFNELVVVVKNGTKIFIKEDTFNQINKTKIKIKVLDQIDICAISMNPYSLLKKYPSKDVVAAITKQTDLFVYDFVGAE